MTIPEQQVWLIRLWHKLWHLSEWLLKEGHLRAACKVIEIRSHITGRIENGYL